MFNKMREFALKLLDLMIIDLNTYDYKFSNATPLFLCYVQENRFNPLITFLMILLNFINLYILFGFFSIFVYSFIFSSNIYYLRHFSNSLFIQIQKFCLCFLEWDIRDLLAEFMNSFKRYWNVLHKMSKIYFGTKSKNHSRNNFFWKIWISSELPEKGNCSLYFIQKFHENLSIK